MVELKRGDIIRNKATEINCIFYSYYRPADNHDTIYALLQEYETPQIVSIDFYEPTGEHIDIFEKVKQGEPANEKVKMAQDLMNSMRDLFWNNDEKENKNMQHNDWTTTKNEDSYGDYEELECIEDRQILINIDDFLALARSEASSKNTLNYILRALRLGIEPSVILGIFDENTGDNIEDLLMKPESPFYIPGDDEETKK